MSIIVEPKSSATVRQESITWAAKLALSSPADTITTSTWTADNGLVVDSTSKSGAVASCVISGGRVGAYCNLTNTIVTTASYTYTETIVIEITPT